MKAIGAAVVGAFVLVFVSAQGATIMSAQTASATSVDSQRALVNDYCAGCHNDKLKSGGFSWAGVDLAHPDQNAQQMERVIRKLRSGMMPPAGARRPDAAALKALATGIETRIDQSA